MSWRPETDLFVQTLVIDEMDPRHEADTVAGIVAEHGLDPERYVYRGVAMPDSVRGLHANGHDYPPEHFDGTVWAMGMEETEQGHTYTGTCADLQGLTPLSYVKNLPHVGAIAVYDRGHMTHEPPFDKWAFNSDATPHLALRGVILAVTRRHMAPKLREQKVDRLVNMLLGPRPNSES